MDTSTKRQQLIMEGKVLPRLPAQHKDEVIFMITSNPGMIYIGREQHFVLAQCAGEFPERMEREQAAELIKSCNARAGERRDANWVIDVEELDCDLLFLKAVVAEIVKLRRISMCTRALPKRKRRRFFSPSNR